MTFSLLTAYGHLLDWAREAMRHHYLGRPPDPRCRPLAYAVMIAGRKVGAVWFGRPESTRCYQGLLTYGSRDDVAAGRAAYDRWEVLNLARLWLHRDVQEGGRLHSPRWLPGFVDRRGVWRSTLASAVIRQALARVGYDYLIAHPPVWVGQPYAIRAVLSYCDTRLHRGVVYRAAGFRLAREAGAIQTWWTPEVAPLTEAQDAEVRALAERHPRSVRMRNRGRSLFDGLPDVGVCP